MGTARIAGPAIASVPVPIRASTSPSSTRYPPAPTSAGAARWRAPRTAPRSAPRAVPDDPLKVHLVDGTYELFRQHFGAPDALRARSPLTVATRGVCGGVLRLLSEGATHIGVATDHVIESFRNDLYDGYKTS